MRGAAQVETGFGGALPPLISGLDAYTVALGQFEDGVELVGPAGANLIKSTASTHSDGVYGTRALRLPPEGAVSLHRSAGVQVNQGTLELWARTGNARPFRRTLFSLPGTQSLDGDRYNDLVIGQVQDGVPAWSEIRFGTPEGPSASAVARFRTFVPRGLAAGDVDGDGKADLVVAQNQAHAVHVFKGPLRPGYSYERPTHPDRVLGVPEPQGLVLLDLDGDGDLDLLVASFAPTTQPIFGFENDGAGRFTPLDFGFFGAAAPAECLAAADVNHDGVPDVLFGSLHALVPSALFLGSLVDGRYTIGLSNPALYSVRSNAALGASIADLDADGWPDVILARPFANEVALHHNRGDGSFPSAPDRSISVVRPFTVTATKDVNNDGYLDVAAASWKLGPFDTPFSQIYFGPDFTESRSFAVENAVSFTLGDMNGDGFTDVAWRSSTASTSPLYLLDLDGEIKASSSFVTQPTIPGAAGPGVAMYAAIAGGTSPYSGTSGEGSGFELYVAGETLVFTVTDAGGRRHAVSMPWPEAGPSLDGFRHVQAEWDLPSGLLSLTVSPASGVAGAVYQAPEAIRGTPAAPLLRLGTDAENQRACHDCLLDDLRLSNVRRSQLP